MRKLVFGDLLGKMHAEEFQRRAEKRKKAVDGIIDYYVRYVPAFEWPRTGLIRGCWPKWLHHFPQSVLDESARELQEMRTE